MKTIPLIFALVVSFVVPAFSQAIDPGGFVGFRWGTPSKEAVPALLQRGGVVRDANDQGDANDSNFTDDVDFAGGRFAGLDVANWQLGFEHGKLVRGQVAFECPAHGDSLYDRLKDALTLKYGEGQTVVKTSGANGSTTTSLVTRWTVGNTSITCRSYGDSRVTIGYGVLPELVEAHRSDL